MDTANNFKLLTLKKVNNINIYVLYLANQQIDLYTLYSNIVY